MKDLEGRVAVVAGATRGAGRSTTNFFSGNGVSVAAMCAESHQYRPLLCQLGGVRQNRQNTNLVPLLLASCLLDRSLRH